MQLAFGVWLGLLLDRVNVLRRVVRTIMLSPVVMPPVVVAMKWVIFLDPFQGAANYVLQSLGLPKSGWPSSPPIVLPVFAMLDTWQAAPLVALLVLGGLQTLPQSVYEAAALDVASGYALLRHITLPPLIPTLVTVAVLRSVDLLRFFDLIYIITQGGPGDASTTLNIYAFRRAFELFDMGYASTLMIALSVTILGVIVCIVHLRRICDWWASCWADESRTWRSGCRRSLPASSSWCRCCGCSRPALRRQRRDDLSADAVLFAGTRQFSDAVQHHAVLPLPRQQHHRRHRLHGAGFRAGVARRVRHLLVTDHLAGQPYPAHAHGTGHAVRAAVAHPVHRYWPDRHALRPDPGPCTQVPPLMGLPCFQLGVAVPEKYRAQGRAKGKRCPATLVEHFG
jgi:multiple sugar transport system permease protein